MKVPNKKAYLPLALVAILAFALYGGAVSVLVFNLQLPLVPPTNLSGKTPTVSFTLYAGEISGSQMGFGTAGNNITSPGPTLRIRVTDIVSVTLVNVGSMPHAFAVTTMPTTGAKVLFNAEIASSVNPLEPGQRRTLVFAPTFAGNFYYICPVSGHAEMGMYGSVVVTG